MPANYDNAAWFYDNLASLVYGNNLNRAQQSLLHYIPQNSKILVVGGGTGKTIEHLSQVYSTGLQITYVEISGKMTAIARKRKSGDNKVEFITAPVEEVDLVRDFDVIITPFLLDNFDGETLTRLFNHLNNSLKPNGIWLNTDFQLTGRWWQPVLLRSMILFFKILCDVETKGLPDVTALFQSAGYNVLEKKVFYGDFIGSTVYKKSQ